MTRKEIEKVLENGGLTQVDKHLWTESKECAIMVEFLYEDDLYFIVNDEKSFSRINLHLGEITDFRVDRVKDFANNDYTEIIIETIFGNQNKFCIGC